LLADSQSKVMVINDDEEQQPFKRGKDGEYEDVRGKSRDEVMLMHHRMINDQEQHLD
jgi:hypothetical protein